MTNVSKNYQFTLVLKNIDNITDKLEDALHEAGCDDALINFRDGVVYLDFDRAATSLEAAVVSAIQDVSSASIGAVASEVLPNNLEVQRYFSEELTSKITTIAKQWKEEGVQEGEVALLKRVLQRRFGELPFIYEQRIASANAETLLKWSDKIFDAKTLEEIFA